MARVLLGVKSLLAGRDMQLRSFAADIKIDGNLDEIRIRRKRQRSGDSPEIEPG
jgi:hypothetical protein